MCLQMIYAHYLLNFIIRAPHRFYFDYSGRHGSRDNEGYGRRQEAIWCYKIGWSDFRRHQKLLYRHQRWRRLQSWNCSAGIINYKNVYFSKHRFLVKIQKMKFKSLEASYLGCVWHGLSESKNYQKLINCENYKIHENMSLGVPNCVNDDTGVSYY